MRDYVDDYGCGYGDDYDHDYDARAELAGSDSRGD